jgi:hypothetical protein
MSHFALVRRLALGLASTLLALATTALAARAGELSGSGSRHPGLRIVGPEEALKRFGEWRADRLWLVLPNGLEFELVTSVDDPVIANRGDGAFHPYDAAEVRRAFDDVNYPLGGIGADVLLLPFPRRAGLESAAAPGLILLSPGTRPIPAEHQHAEAVHELGHVVQYARLPDHDVTGWERYRALRGIEDCDVYSSVSVHADRPHEIFAEDFRALFGGALANYTGTIENPELSPPSSVPGLESFLRELAAAVPASALAAWPNPSRGHVSFARWQESGPVDVFDVSGRRLATLAPEGGADGVRWIWNGRDGQGRAVVGVVFARPRSGRGETVRVTMLP